MSEFFYFDIFLQLQYMSSAISEPLLQPDESRFVMFPVKHTDVWDSYKKSINCLWKTEDIDLSRDYVDWVKLTGDKIFFIKMVLAFFALSVSIIIEN